MHRLERQVRRFPQYFMQFQGKPTLARYSGVGKTCGKHTVIGGRFFRESTLVLLYRLIINLDLRDRESKKF